MHKSNSILMTKQTIAFLIGVVLMNLPTNAAADAGVSGGLSLLNEGSARWSSLGQAGVAAHDDIAGMAYNPATLGSLSSGQASFLYQQGLIEDAYGQFMIGTPRGEKSALGFSFGYYNGGDIELTNENGQTESVNAQTDMTAALGYSVKMGGMSMGLSGKVLNSKLIDQYSGTAYAADLGMVMPVGSRLQLGAAALNYGTQLKYAEEGDPLPRMLQVGGSFALRQNATLLLSIPYMVNEKMTTPSLGLETLFGPLAIRAGYRSGKDVQEFTMGAGFALGRSSLDYAFGMVNQLDAQHKVSMAMRFGGASATPALITKKPTIERTVAAPTKQRTVEQTASKTTTVERRHSLGGQQVLRAPARTRRVYIVKQGDTLASIAKEELGDKRQWQSIYSANKHLIDDPASIEKGMRIIIP